MERIYLYIIIYPVLIMVIAMPVIVDHLVIRQAPKYQSSATSSVNHKTVGFKTGYHGNDNQNQDAAVAETDTDVKG